MHHLQRPAQLATLRALGAQQENRVATRGNVHGERSDVALPYALERRLQLKEFEDAVATQHIDLVEALSSERPKGGCLLLGPGQFGAPAAEEQSLPALAREV